MTKIAIVYYSGYGHTKKQAEAVYTGVLRSGGSTALLISVNTEGNINETDWEFLDATDAIIFGSPTYMGMVSWQFKKFIDATSKRWRTQAWKDKIAAGFTNSSSLNGDKGVTINYLITFSLQHGMVWCGTGIMPSAGKVATRDDINVLGCSSGAMAQSPSDASPEEAPGAGDLETASQFGQRVTEFTKKVKRSN